MFKFISEETGSTSLEFGVVSALVSIIVIASFSSVGSSLANKYGEVALTTTSALHSDAVEEDEEIGDHLSNPEDNKLGIGGTVQSTFSL